MSFQSFNGQVFPTTTTTIGAGSYRLEFNFNDISGAWRGTDISVGDEIYLDTTAYAPDTISQYKITSLITVSASHLIVNMLWDDLSGSTPIDPMWGLGLQGFISRPTSTQRYDTTSANVPTKFISALLNNDLYRIDTNGGGGGTGGTTFNFAQNTPSDHWVVVHNLGRKPTVTVSTTVGDMIYGQVVYDSGNQLSVYFGYALTGYAYCT